MNRYFGIMVSLVFARHRCRRSLRRAKVGRLDTSPALFLPAPGGMPMTLDIAGGKSEGGRACRGGGEAALQRQQLGCGIQALEEALGCAPVRPARAADRHDREAARPREDVAAPVCRLELGVDG